MRTATQKRKLLRDLMAGPNMLLAPSVGMPLTARLVEEAGFPAIHGAGSVAHQISGYADAGLLSMSEMVGRMAALSDAVDIPVVADMDTGFGNVANVIRTVREYERAGVAAFHLEDTAAKAPFGADHSTPVVSRREMVNKIRAAVDARTDESMVIIARSEVRGDPDEFVARLVECVEAGADACWVSGALGEDGVKELKKAVNKPFVGVLPRGLTGDQFHAWGANCAVIPGALELAAQHAQRQLLDELKRSGSPEAYFTNLAGIDDTRRSVGRNGKGEYDAIMERFGGE